MHPDQKHYDEFRLKYTRLSDYCFFDRNDVNCSDLDNKTLDELENLPVIRELVKRHLYSNSNPRSKEFLDQRIELMQYNLIAISHIENLLNLLGPKITPPIEFVIKRKLNKCHMAYIKYYASNSWIDCANFSAVVDPAVDQEFEKYRELFDEFHERLSPDSMNELQILRAGQWLEIYNRKYK